MSNKKKQTAFPAGGRPDLAREYAQKQKPAKKTKPAPAGGVDLAKEHAIKHGEK